jgi:hypothetical protein
MLGTPCAAMQHHSTEHQNNQLQYFGRKREREREKKAKYQHGF